MLGITQTIERSDTSNRESVSTMNKLSEDNEPVFTDDAVYAHPDGRIPRLTKDGDLCDNVAEEDDADQKSLTLESIKEQSKLSCESQRDRDFVSESSLTIVSNDDLFQENSRWWSMINNSESNSNKFNPQLEGSMNNPNNPTLYSSINDINNQTANPSHPPNTNTPTTNTSNTSRLSNYFHNGHRKEKRRSSLLSDITFESDEHDDDAFTTESCDSSWANSSALLTSARRFAPNYYPGSNNVVNNETIQEEHYDYHEKLKHSRDGNMSSSSTNAAPVIPRRRVSMIGKGRLSGNSQPSAKAAAIAASAANQEDFDLISSKITHYNHATLRAMARGNAAAPTIPKRTSSHNSKMSSVKNNSMLYQIYNASMSSIVDSQLSEPTFFSEGEGSAAAAAAAAYLSTGTSSQNEEARTVGTSSTSDTSATSVLKNQFSREKVPIHSEMPPVLPERRVSSDSYRTSFTSYGTYSSFEDEDEVPSVVHEEEPYDSDSASPPNTTPTSHHLPSVPMRKRSSSGKGSSGSSQSSESKNSTTQHSQHSQPRMDTQPPACPMRKDSNHYIRRSPNAAAIRRHRHAKFFKKDELLCNPHQPSPKHRPPTKPMRTNSSSVIKSPTSTTSSSYS